MGYGCNDKGDLKIFVKLKHNLNCANHIMLKSQAAGGAYMNYQHQIQDDAVHNDSELSIASEADCGSSSVNFINFNQDATCLAIGLNKGYRIFTCKPEFSKCLLVTNGVSIGLIEMLYNTSLLVTVALGDEAGSLPRKLKIINTKSQNTICDLIFPSTILLVKLSKHRMVVLLEEQIYIYDVMTMRLLHTIETSPNVNRLCTMSEFGFGESKSSYLAYPSPPKTIAHDSLLVSGVYTNGGLNSAQNNILSVSNAPNRIGDAIIFDLTSLQPLAVIEAHKSALAAMCLSSDGNLLATASDKGTIVRVFSVHSGVKLFQFRRGTYPTKIYSLGFSVDNKFVVATSSSETVHVFRLGDEELLANKQKQKKDMRDRRSKLQWDHATIEEEMEHAHISAQRDMSEEDESIEDDGDDSDAEADNDTIDGDVDRGGDAYDDIGVEAPNKQRKLSQGSSTSFTSFNSALSNEDNRDKSEPVIDQNRLSVARIIRRSSQTLGRKAAQKMGDFLPSRFSLILEPTRHFASLKIQTVGKDVRSIATIGSVSPGELVRHKTSQANDNAEDINLHPITSSTSQNSETLSNPIHISVVTSEGFFYIYELDPERGGDCILLHQYSLLDE